jgi:chromosome segregation ATPase
MNEPAAPYATETIEESAGAADIYTRAINTPEVRELAKATDSLASHYDTYQVSNDVEYADGAEELKRIKGQQQILEDRRFAITRPMDAAKKAVMDFFRPFSDRLDDAEIHVKRALTGYATEQKRIADEAARIERQRQEKEARRLREEAKAADEAAAKKERDRLAELQRKEDERAAEEAERLAEERKAAKTEEDQRRAKEQEEAAQKRRDDEQERLHQDRLASEAAERERTARAETLETRAETVTTAPVATAPKVKGISTRKKWSYEVVDLGQVPREYLMLNGVAVGGVVRALKGETNIPGIRVVSEDIMSARK